MDWKYGLILVARKGGKNPLDCQSEFTLDGDRVALVELYSNDEGEYTSFAKVNLDFLPSTAVASILKQIESDGVSTWFYDHGVFSWSDNEDFWDWFPTEEPRTER
jgi:hypothetical protein